MGQPPVVPTRPPTGKTRLERVDEERKHFEGLFQTRINFHLAFASIFLVAESTIKDEMMRLTGLAFSTAVSILFTLAIVRTYRLVGMALKEITDHDPSHPYKTYRDRIAFPWNANHSLVVVPFLITLMFMYMCGYYYLHSRNPSKHADQTSTIYQDNSDRRVYNAAPTAPTPAVKAKRPVCHCRH